MYNQNDYSNFILNNHWFKQTKKNFDFHCEYQNSCDSMKTSSKCEFFIILFYYVTLHGGTKLL